jgi:hypothetical protein
MNAATDKNALLDKIDRYRNKMGCSRKIDECASPGAAVSVEKRCVGKKSAD